MQRRKLDVFQFSSGVGDTPALKLIYSIELNTAFSFEIIIFWIVFFWKMDIELYFDFFLENQDIE